MHIRVVDLWVVKEKTVQQHLELVIQDGKGDQIHVTTRSRYFNDWVEQLKEHETYYLYNEELWLMMNWTSCHEVKIIREIYEGGKVTSNASVMDISTSDPTDHPNQPIMTLSSELSLSAQPSSSANHAWSLSASSCSTPTKRIDVSSSVNDLIQAEDLTSKQSSTKEKPGKKVKHVKKE
ncbi:hypothetical protein RYX36_007932 [Vicia faba]